VMNVSSYAMEVLMDYDFPGNVRELENIIERGVALESSHIILPESLTLSMHRKGQVSPELTEKSNLFDEETAYAQGLDNYVAAIEKSLIEDALNKTRNSKMRAADLLKVSFRSLRYKIKKYEIG